MRYFDHLFTVEEIKPHYKKLAMENHPDRGGSTATMQEINAQYADALKRADGQTSTGTDGAEHTYTYDAQTEQEIVDKIAELIAAGVAQHAEISLIGTWIWITGDTKPIKDTLSKLGCKYHAKRICWYWQNAPYKHRFNRNADLSDLAEKYGETKFRNRERQRVAA